MEMTSLDLSEGHTVELDTISDEELLRLGGDRELLPALTIVYHPDVGRVGERVFLSDLAAGRAVAVSRKEPLFAAPPTGEAVGVVPEQPLGDPYLSRSPLHLRPADGGAVVIDPTGTGTSVAVDGRAVTEPLHVSAERLGAGVALLLARRVVLLLHRISRPPGPPPSRFGLVGDSEGLLEVRREIAKVADLDVPVLIRGETGTGKELVARALHRASLRRSKAYLTLNMGAVPPTLAASELFGAVKGAFTGADRSRAGFFRKADGGTLFLDEVGETPGEVQPMLLRVLESGEIQPVGALDPQRVDVRVLAATDADLDGAIERGDFRAPLLHRLAGYTLHLPPLRERRDDVGRLLVHFLRNELRRVGEEHRLRLSAPAATPWLSGQVVARLVAYPWPGNVRELRNLVRQVVIESRGLPHAKIGRQMEKALREAAREGEPPLPPPTGETPVDLAAVIADLEVTVTRPGPKKRYRDPADVTEEELLTALSANRYRVKTTAQDLGVSRSSFYALMNRFDIPKASDLTRERIEEEMGRVGEDDLDRLADALSVSPDGLRLRLRELGLEITR
jgi:two-component system, NtrC family, nitrogen regulation response regulator GlnG